MTITINGEHYKAASIDGVNPEVALKAWRLTQGAKIYDVWRDPDGFLHCDCFDHISRRENLDPKGCKHCRFLVENGLI